MPYRNRNVARWLVLLIGALGVACTTERTLLSPAAALDAGAVAKIGGGGGSGDTGIWYTSNDTGYWNGRPPAGDSSPPLICCGGTQVYPPVFGTNGWVSGWFDFNGDKGWITLNYTATKNSTTLLQSTYSSPGEGCKLADGMACNHSVKVSLQLGDVENAYCEVHVVVGGTGYTVKTRPYRWLYPLIRLIDTTVTPKDWQPQFLNLPASQGAGPDCDIAPTSSETRCDDEGTSEVEYCPVAGDPANPDTPGGDYTIRTISIETEPTSSSGTGYWKCTELWHFTATYQGEILEEWYECHDWAFVAE